MGASMADKAHIGRAPRQEGPTRRLRTRREPPVPTHKENNRSFVYKLYE